MLIEGEEECGSAHLFDFVKNNAAELKQDFALVCDTSMWDGKTPAITTSLRGLVYEEVKVTCADRDLHSGLFGGAAQNPLRVLSQILGAMHDKNGKVTIPGFYDGVKELPKDIKAELKKLKLTPKEFLGGVGLKIPAGEKNRMLLEQISTRPTAEINGMIGGYTGEGAKTVLPAQATAKVSFRLVGDQNPKKIQDAFRKFVRARLPKDAKVEFTNFGLAPAIQLPFDNPALMKARAALKDGVGQDRGDGGRGRLDPDRRRLQARARHGHHHGRLRARRRPRAFAEREIRPHLVPQGNAQLGADFGGAGGVRLAARPAPCGAQPANYRRKIPPC